MMVWSFLLIGLFLAGCENVTGHKGQAPAAQDPATEADQGDSRIGATSGGEDETQDADRDAKEEKSAAQRGNDSECATDFSTALSSEVQTSGSAQAPLIGQINFTMTADVDVDAQSSSSRGSIALDASITRFSPSIGRGLAQNIIESYRDPLRLEYVTGSDFDELPASFKKIACAFPPVKSLKNDSYEMEYEPAIPFLFNASSDADIEMKATTFDIEARIKKHPTAAPGTHKGKATVSVKGGLASVTFEFGAVAPKANSTPVKSLKYTVSSPGDFDQIELSAFVSDNSLIVLKVEE